MDRRKNFHLPAYSKILLGLFFAIFFLFTYFAYLPQRLPLFALTAEDCKGVETYFTCHYQTTPGLYCPISSKPTWIDPFHFCGCAIDGMGQCIKFVNGNWCYNQTLCNTWIQAINNTPCALALGDCCGCSGRPRPLPTPTATPRPTPTPSPIAGCYQSCISDSNCPAGLKCGYHVSVGRRICNNPSCPAETDCKCSW